MLEGRPLGPLVHGDGRRWGQGEIGLRLQEDRVLPMHPPEPGQQGLQVGEPGRPEFGSFGGGRLRDGDGRRPDFRQFLGRNVGPGHRAPPAVSQGARRREVLPPTLVHERLPVVSRRPQGVGSRRLSWLPRTRRSSAGGRVRSRSGYTGRRPTDGEKKARGDSQPAGRGRPQGERCEDCEPLLLGRVRPRQEDSGRPLRGASWRLAARPKRPRPRPQPSPTRCTNRLGGAG